MGTPVNRQTHMSENIALPQLRLLAVKKRGVGDSGEREEKIE